MLREEPTVLRFQAKFNNIDNLALSAYITIELGYGKDHPFELHQFFDKTWSLQTNFNPLRSL